MRRRLMVALAVAQLAALLSVAPVVACGGLIGPNGAVNLLRTTTGRRVLRPGRRA